MVYVNSKKFACESCIKGHRSSSCHHTDRPLFEIKKKGRPVSQCTKCRELRQSKKFHSKCTCNHQMEKMPAMQPLASSSGSKTRRFIPIVPALPNGLRDVLTASQSSSSHPPDIRQRVDTLLNPCDCKSVWKCHCGNNKSSLSSSVPEGPSTTNSTDALSTLAHAAALRCCSSSTDETLSGSSSSSLSSSYSLGKSKAANIRPRPSSPVSSNKRQKQDKQRHRAKTTGPDLAPILYSPNLSLHSRATPMPDFPSMPPLSTVSCLAGSGCTCGFQCSCPGCVEHRGPTHASSERRNCADGCGTCIDPTLGMNLPSSSSGSSSRGPASSSGTSILDRFFAQAAALPPPPFNRKMTLLGLDPMDTTRYMDYSGSQGGQTFSFGTVKLPKLECCSGQCNCPAGRCTCRATCAGCCSDEKQSQKQVPTAPVHLVAVESQQIRTIEVTPVAQVRSCCAGKI